MGNVLQKHTPAEDIPTPKIVEMTPTEVNIIKETWKIPSANVSADICDLETLIATFVYSNSTQLSLSSTLSSSDIQNIYKSLELSKIFLWRILR